MCSSDLTAFSTWQKGEIPKPEIPEAAYGIPMMCNPGLKERDDERFKGAWTGSMEMFKAYRAKGAPIGFAPDPRTSHECGDSRYLAIPFFDACLALRLPDDANASGGLKLVAPQQGWLAALLSETAVPAAMYEGDRAESMWLPDERVAKAWSEYVKTGAVSDSTPPTKPHDVAAKMLKDEEGIELRWNAVADFESGLQRFIILRDGQELATAPKQPVEIGRAHV